MVARMTSGGWIISHRFIWITVYVLCYNAQVNLILILMTFVCLLYSINCPTVNCLPSILFILWRDTTSELWTPVKEHIEPHVWFLVINDNSYGLMVALSYMCRTCP
jgi:hypothetical protein